MSTRRRIWLGAICLAAIFGSLLCAGQLVAQAPGATVTSVDAKTGVVTAKVNSTGQVFEFTLANRALLSGVHAGQGVFVNLGKKQVSLDGKQPAGTITSVTAPGEGRGASITPSGNPAKSPGGSSVKAPILTAAIVPLPRVEELQLNGIVSPNSENKGGEADPQIALPRAHGINLPAANASNAKLLRDEPNAQQILQAAAQDLRGFQIHLALLGGHKYMINNCLGIKASAGNFDLVVPDPDLRIENTSVVLTFSVSRILFNALTIRLRPDVTDIIEPCHFSGRIGIGGKADDVRLEYHFDPILYLEQCKIGSMGQIHTIWRIGSLKLDPLPGEVGIVAKNMIEDAPTYAANFNLTDRVVAALNGGIGLQCHQ
jgi:hypothetical protein